MRKRKWGREREDERDTQIDISQLCEIKMLEKFHQTGFKNTNGKVWMYNNDLSRVLRLCLKDNSSGPKPEIYCQRGVTEQY